MTDSCRVRAYLLAETERRGFTLGELSPSTECSGPLVSVLLGVTKEAGYVCEAHLALLESGKLRWEQVE